MTTDLARCIRSRGVPTLSEFELRPWGLKEFYIHDPHGNLLRFGCLPEEVDVPKDPR